MITMVDWIAQLSDGELEARLHQAGVDGDEVGRLVRYRDSDGVAAYISDLLDGDR